MKPYRNPPPKQDPRRRESPQDFMLAFLKWKAENPDRMVTPKGFAIIRGQNKKQIDDQKGKSL